VETTGNVRSSSFLFQRVNSVLLHDDFVGGGRPESRIGCTAKQFVFLPVIFEPPGVSPV